MERASLLIIDHIENNLKERLKNRIDLNIIGTTDNADIGFTMAESSQPMLIMLNIDLDDNDGYAIADIFATEFPASSLILMTNSDNKRVLRHALHVGAKDVINLPIEDEQLNRILNRVIQHERKRRDLYKIEKKSKPQFKTITVFSTKGGVGKTTVATNLAIALRQLTKKRVVLLDLDLTAGNVALMTGVNWKRSIKDVVDEINNLDKELLDSYCIEHTSGLKILPAPIHPDLSNFISAEHIEKILKQLSQVFNYVVIDAPSYFHDTVIPALEQSQDILTVTTLDLASIQNLKQCLEVLNELSMNKKTRVIINRLGSTAGVKVDDLENELGNTIQYAIPECDKIAVNAVNMGEPIFISARSSNAAKKFEELASKLMLEDDEPRHKKIVRGIFARR